MKEGNERDLLLFSQRSAHPAWLSVEGSKCHRPSRDEYTQIRNVIVNLSDDEFDWYADEKLILPAYSFKLSVTDPCTK